MPNLFEKMFGGGEESKPDSYGFQAVPGETGETFSLKGQGNIEDEIKLIKEELEKLGERGDADANEQRAALTRKLDILEGQLKPKAY